MIGAVTGRIVEHFDGEIILAVGSDSSWIGYQLRIPVHARYAHLAIGTVQTFYTYTHVREDALDLFGFLNIAEKKLFLMLTSVNGIGPKMGLGILSAYSAEQIVQYILSGDKDAITEVSGVGKKTAERIVLELKDTIAKKWAGASKTDLMAATPAPQQMPTIAQEAIFALLGLGFKEIEAKSMVERALAKASADEITNPANRTVEDLIKSSLQR